MTGELKTNVFTDLVELDALRLTVIVDNEVDFMTSVPQKLGHITQALSLFKDQRNIDKEKTTESIEDHHNHKHDDQSEKTAIRTVAFDFNDTGIKDGVEHRVLFDTGPQSAIFLENAKRLEIEFEKIEMIVLSHWHIDHSGGMLAAIEKIHEARSKKKELSPLSVDLHPDRPDQRGICLTRPTSGAAPDHIEYVAWGKDPSFEEIEKAGGKVSLSDQAHTVCNGFFGVSGLIPRNTSYETGIPNHCRWQEKTKSWEQEPEIMDERYLVARVKSKGIVVLTGCSHAGVINVCQDVKRAFDKEQNNEIFVVIGGFHLAGGSVETRIKATVDDMIELNPSYMAPGHCSGWRAKSALEQAMPGKVASLGVGTDFHI
ncbi:hypothetical protein BGZ46_010891 [Entomortierella lignicola]|nr:hypothetical protein BGZ46_010891 [Entomortierella lignicola]